ncbi:MAG: hypothetical protein H0X66_22210 [Verrucomicrobia bacterium]|nr:hypothetical protein [Verrucomicrobiota bacterium]
MAIGHRQTILGLGPQSSAKVFQGTPGTWGYGLASETRVVWRLYAEGYRRAAEKLFAVWSADLRDGSYLLFPMAYLYRHHVELRIKELLFACADYLQLPSDWRLNHDLVQFWALLRPLLVQASPDMPAQELDNVERIIIELSSKDPKSFLFRYPADLAGSFHFSDLDALDLENYCGTLRQLSRFLDCVSDCLQTELQVRDDALDP